MNSRSRNQQGFTLLELLVVIGIISLLCYLGLTSFWVYRADAAYSVAQSVLRNSKVSIEAGQTDTSNLPGPVDIVQTAQGPIQDVAARAYLPNMQLPRNVKFSAQYDPDCLDETCQSDLIEIKHCLGKQYIRWIRFGDGSEPQMLPIQGSGCN